MSMQLSSLEVLEQAQFPQVQARAILRVLEAESAARREDLVTKGYLREEINRLDVRIESVKADLVRWMFSALAGQTLLIMGIMYFLLQNAHRS